VHVEKKKVQVVNVFVGCWFVVVGVVSVVESLRNGKILVREMVVADVAVLGARAERFAVGSEREAVDGTEMALHRR